MKKAAYVAPRVITLGKIAGLTLGSGGSCKDSGGGFKKKAYGGGACPSH